MKSIPKLLITGATGFIGQHACQHFLKVGFDVTGVTRKNNLDMDKKIQLAYCDLTDKEAVKKLVQKVRPQYVLHLAGKNHVEHSWIDPVSSLESNFISTLYLIETLRHESPACKIVVVGSALQFIPEDLSTIPHPYSVSKTLQVLLAQSWVSLYKMDIVIAKPSNLIGPGNSNGICSILAKKIVDMEKSNKKKNLDIHNLGAKRNFLDVRDAMTAFEILLMKGKAGEIYGLVGEDSYSLEHIVNKLQDLTSVNFEVKSQLQNNIEPKVKTMPLKLRNLGWKPSISLESSLKDILNFYRENNKT